MSGELASKVDQISKIIARVGVGLLSIALSIGLMLFNETRQDVKVLLLNQARFEQQLLNKDRDDDRRDREIEKISIKLDKIR